MADLSDHVAVARLPSWAGRDGIATVLPEGARGAAEAPAAPLPTTTVGCGGDDNERALAKQPRGLQVRSRRPRRHLQQVLADSRPSPSFRFNVSIDAFAQV